MAARIVTAVTLLVVAGALLVALVPQAVGLERTAPLAQLVSLRAVAAVVGALLGLMVLAALAVRRLRVLAGGLAALLLLFAGTNGAVLLARGVVNPAPAAASDDELVVLSWNTLGDATDPARIADLVIETGADVVALPETTEEAAVEVAVRTREAGRPMYVHTVALDDIVAARSTSLLVSPELGTYSVDDSLGTTPAVPSLVARPDDGTGPVLVAAHPVAPIPEYFDQWREGLDWLADACRGDDVVLAGDLNSTLDHYARLPASPGATLGDCVDAAESTGAAAVGTWPAGVPPLIGSPIDHVMATPSWRATTTRVVTDRDGTGSDHRPIVAHLRRVG